MESNYFPPTEKEAREKGISSTERKNAGFPSRLRELRNKAGESQAALSKVLGVTKSTISLYETGDNVPDARTIRKMALHFGVSSDYLLALANDPTTDKDIQDFCDFSGLTSETIIALHDIHDKTGFVKRLIEDIVVPYDYASPIEQALSLLVQSAVAKNADFKEFEDNYNGIHPAGERMGIVDGFYIENGRYTADHWLVASMLLERAEACIEAKISTSFEEARDSIAAQIRGKTDSEVYDFYLRPWTEEEAEVYGE